MKILILGDVMGNTGRKALEENFKKITTEHKIDFTVVNGENAAEDGRALLKKLRTLFSLLVWT